MVFSGANDAPQSQLSYDAYANFHGKPGEYEMTVVWREFEPSATETPFWSLKAVRRAVTKLRVYEGEPPAGAKAVALAAGDFRPVPVPKEALKSTTRSVVTFE